MLESRLGDEKVKDSDSHGANLTRGTPDAFNRSILFSAAVYIRSEWSIRFSHGLFESKEREHSHRIFSSPFGRGSHLSGGA